MAKITAQLIIETFDFEIANKQPVDLTKEINYPGIHRVGLELAGVYESTHSEKQIVGWGTKEQKWLAEKSPREQEAAIRRGIVSSTPLLFLSGGVKGNVLNLILKIADELGIPTVCTKYHLSDVIAIISPFLSSKLSPSESVHGSLVIVYGIGVMIIGKSGIGKSEAVLELIQENQLFVSDDTVVITRVGNNFIGRGSEITNGYLESRGIGIINVAHLYGAKVARDETDIDLVIELVPAEEADKVDRLGNSNLTYNVLGGKIPRIQIPVNLGRNISALIKAATGAFIAKQAGHDSLLEIQNRISTINNDNSSGGQ